MYRLEKDNPPRLFKPKITCNKIIAGNLSFFQKEEVWGGVQKKKERIDTTFLD